MHTKSRLSRMHNYTIGLVDLAGKKSALFFQEPDLDWWLNSPQQNPWNLGDPIDTKLPGNDYHRQIHFQQEISPKHSWFAQLGIGYEGQTLLTPDYISLPKLSWFSLYHPGGSTGTPSKSWTTPAIIFHQSRFAWNKGMSLPRLLFGVASCQAAIIWPDIM